MKFCNLSEKRLTVLKFKLKLNLKFMLKESKTIKIMKGIKNRKRLRKSYISSFLHRNKQQMLVYYDNKEIHAKNIVSGCVVRTEHRNDILNPRSNKKKHLNVFTT